VVTPLPTHIQADLPTASTPGQYHSRSPGRLPRHTATGACTVARSPCMRGGRGVSGRGLGPSQRHVQPGTGACAARWVVLRMVGAPRSCGGGRGVLWCGMRARIRRFHSLRLALLPRVACSHTQARSAPIWSCIHLQAAIPLPSTIS